MIYGYVIFGLILTIAMIDLEVLIVVDDSST